MSMLGHVAGLGHRPSAVRARCAGDKAHLSRPMYSAGTLRATRPSVQAGAVMTDKSQAIVDVDLGDRSYPIYIGPGLLDQPNLLQEHVPGKKVLVVTNETIAPLYLDRCVATLTKDSDLQVGSVVLPDGEKYKSVDIVQKVWDAAIEQRLDRNTTFVALGGGVIGDMTGFAAACWVRGCHFIQIPTTVMAQVDSSVGGKTGVNHPGGKNMIGAFYQPQAVVVDIDCLDTLPDRELASGISEIIKYGLIRDAEFFGWLEENIDRLLARDTEAFVYAIERSCINKAEVVAEDEKEGGVRASLNLGHTFGHAIETHTGYGTWLHGEAVAAGTMMAMDLSKRMGWVDPDIVERARALLLKCKLPSGPPAGMEPQRFHDIMSLDKKVKDGKLRLVLLKGPLGTCVITSEYDQQMLQQTLEAFCH